MQIWIDVICLVLLMWGYLLMTIREPTRLEARSRQMLEEWILQGRPWSLTSELLMPVKKRLMAPWERLMQSRKEEAAQREIAQGISYLRNAAAMGRGEHMSTELLLSELAAVSSQLSDTYYSMANYLRLGDTQAALRLMEDQIKHPIAGDYGRLLIQWEKLAPSLLMETLISYQKAIEQMRETKQKKRDELISDLVYFPVIMNVMLILVNFIYVAYFIDQRDALLTVVG